MLIEFRVENFRSLRDEQVLTLEADHRASEGDLRPREVAGHSRSLLPATVLYGANASGKSNVLKAIAFMRNTIVDSHRLWLPEEGVPSTPFAWGKKSSEPSHFEANLLVHDVKYEYGFSATRDSFIEEWLYAYPHGKRQVWFERDEGNEFKIGEHLKGEHKVIQAITRPNSLFLSAAAQNQHSQLLPLYSWFSSIKAINISGNANVSWGTLMRVFEEKDQPSHFEQSPGMAKRFRSLLREADLGIEDVKLRPSSADFPFLYSRFLIKHQGPYKEAWLPLDEESGGTKTMFRMAMPIIQVLEQGGVIVVDELESSLHPNLARKIVEMFNDPKTNPKNAQIICSTHDTNLLGTTVGDPVFRRDQVWLTEKKKDGATELYPLTDFKPRSEENLERGYLQGRYGAIPVLGDLINVS